MDSNSTRYVLTALSRGDKEVAQILDSGIVWNRSLRSPNLPKSFLVSWVECVRSFDTQSALMGSMPCAKQSHFVGMGNASLWRFQLNTDGHTASSRLGHLLGINSVVLKERSPWIEYYYRALKEGKDHLAFSVDELLPMLREIRVGMGSLCSFA